MRARLRFLPVVVLACFASVAAASEKVWYVGVLSSYSRPSSFGDHPFYGPFLRRLGELGYVEGRNLRVEWAFSDGNDARLTELAADLVAHRVDAIVTLASPGIRAAQSATSTIPIVFIGGADVVAQGFVKSLARPGGNTTGFQPLIAEGTAKQVEILEAFVPHLSRLGYLFNSLNPSTALVLPICRKAAEKTGTDVVPFDVRSKEDIEAVVATAPGQRVGAMICGADLFLHEAYPLVARLALKYRIPASASYPEFAEAGGLVAYGPDRAELWTRVAVYLDRIFKGEKPEDLPVQQPTIFHLVINRKTARALGLEIPAQLLVQADQVID